MTEAYKDAAYRFDRQLAYLFGPCPEKNYGVCSLSMSQNNYKFMPRKLLAFALCAATLTACSQPPDLKNSQGKKMTEAKKEIVYFDVSMLSYYERPIFDVKLNGVDIGAAGEPPHGDHGGIIIGVTVPLGPQVITWRLDGVDKNGKPFKNNGDIVKALNQPILSSPDPKAHYLGVHIYPDNTVEITQERFWPTNTEKGNAFIQAWEMKRGK